MKILFAVWPRNATWNHGVALLSAIAKQEGAETSLCVLTSAELFYQHLFSFRPDWVFFSGVTVHDARQLLPYAIQAHEAGFKTALGGVFFRHSGAAKPDFVDVLCTGEAENALIDFIRTENPRMLQACKPVKDLNSLPLPDYALFEPYPMEDRGVPFLVGKTIFPYHSARGCPHKCSFCLAPYQRQTIPCRVRTRVEQDLSQYADKHQIVAFLDELLPYRSRTWRESWGDMRMPFAGYIRGDISPKHLEWLIDRGLAGCTFGIESGDEQYRNKVLKKDLTDADIWRTLSILQTNKVPYMTSFILDTPGSTPAEKQATYHMAEQMGGNAAVLWQYEPLILGEN